MKMIELSCAIGPDHTIDWLVNIREVWRILDTPEKELAKQATHTILMRAKLQLPQCLKLSSHLFEKLTGIFQEPIYLECYRSDPTGKFVLELFLAFAFFGSDDHSTSKAAIDWFLSCHVVCGHIPKTDAYGELLSEVIKHVMNQPSSFAHSYLPLYSMLFSSVVKTDNSEIHCLIFLMFCLNHKNPDVAAFSQCVIMEIFPYAVQCLKCYAKDILSDPISSCREFNKHSYEKAFHQFCTILLRNGACSSALSFIRDPELIRYVSPSLLSNLRASILITFIEIALKNKTLSSISEAIDYYCSNLPDLIEPEEIRLSNLEKIFELAILYLTEHKRYNQFIEAIRLIIAAVYHQPNFKTFPIKFLMQTAFGCGENHPPHALDQEKTYSKCPIILTQKLLTSETKDLRSIYLQSTVSYMILRELMMRRFSFDENLFNCIELFFLNNSLANSATLYSNHLSRCLDLLAIAENTGILNVYPARRDHMTFLLNTPAQLKERINAETINYFRHSSLKHIERLSALNTYASYEIAFALLHHTFPIFYEHNAEDQIKAFLFLFESLKVNPLEKYPQNEEDVLDFWGADPKSFSKEEDFLNGDLNSFYDLYNEILQLQDMIGGKPQSLSRSSALLSIKIDFACTMIESSQFQLLSSSPITVINKDPLVYLLFAETVAAIIDQDLSAENYAIYGPLHARVCSLILQNLQKLMPEGKHRGHCLKAVNDLAHAAIKLYLIEENRELLDNAHRLIKEYTAFSEGSLSSQLLLRWKKKMTDTGNESLIAYANDLPVNVCVS